MGDSFGFSRQHLFIPLHRKKGRTFRCVLSAYQKSLAEFAARRRQRNKIIFSRDMCVRENTSQAASVEFLRTAQKLCAQQTASLLSEKPEGFFDSLKGRTFRSVLFSSALFCLRYLHSSL